MQSFMSGGVIVTEQTLHELISSGDQDAIHSAYNALDCCVPREVWEVLIPRLDENTGRIYRFEHRCQMPAIAMALRGVLINPTRRAEAIAQHEAETEKASNEVNVLAKDIWDRTELRIGRCGEHHNHLWPRGVADDDPAKACRRCGLGRLQPTSICVGSSPQIQYLLYELLGVNKRYDRVTGSPTVDAEALESIANEMRRKAAEHPTRRKHYLLVAKIAGLCLKAKKEQKQVGYARSRLGADGRMRSSFNVGAAETGRWSASKAPDWTGWNIQQISDRLRGMVVADPGLELFYADLEQAESRIVAWDAGDAAYMDAHETSDVHTAVCKLVWPGMAWTGDDAHDRKLAERPTDFDPDHSYRDYAKRIQHGGNMGRTPQGVARQIHIPVAQAENIYGRMYGGWGHQGAFPKIKARHRAIAEELKRTGSTVSCLGRRRQFLGRSWDDDTVREALGQLEQSPVADILDLALLRVWQELDIRLNVWDAPSPDQPNRVWLLAQVHDAILGLYRPGDLDTLRRVKELMEIPLELNGRVMTIPVEIMVGPSWAKAEMHKVKL